MSILVVCPGCHKSFKVHEKFAGRTGPCPNCKQPLTIPKQKQEVKIHGEEGFTDGGRSITGELLLKPIARKETKLNPVVAAIIAGATVALLFITWIAGDVIERSLFLRGVGVLLVAPPLVIAAYTFLRNDELEPYRGKALYIRTGICSIVYAGLWGVFAYLAAIGVLTGEIYMWLVVAPPLMIVGALTALACFDLDFGNGFFHYTFYLLGTLLLRWAAGMPGIWNLGGTPPI